MKSFKVSYTDKTKLRELLFPAYFEGKIDKDSLIARFDISERQFYRLQRKYLVDKKLTHGLYSKLSNHRIDELLRSQIIYLHKTEYKDLSLNYPHFQELLALRNNISISAGSLRNILLSEKLTSPRRRKKRIYMLREPKATFNQMLQLDGTFRDFLGTGQLLCLMHLVDDSTKTSMGMLCEAECTKSALTLLYQWCLKYGIPESIYSDRHGTYKVNERQRLTIEEELEGSTVRLSEFGVICKRLGIQQIYAYSPQAKGRVERKHQLYTDRWLKELKLNKITTINEANNFLFQDGGFMQRLNGNFTIDPREARSDNVLQTASDLAQHFRIENNRTVRNDYTISFNSVIYQIIKVRNINPRSKVQINQHLDDTMTISFNNRILEYIKLANYVKPEIKKEIKNFNLMPNRTYTPNETHPYKAHYRPVRKNQKTSDSKQLELMAKLYA